MTHFSHTLAQRGHLIPPRKPARDWWYLIVVAVSLWLIALSIPIHFLIAVNWVGR